MKYVYKSSSSIIWNLNSLGGCCVWSYMAEEAKRKTQNLLQSFKKFRWSSYRIKTLAVVVLFSV